MGFLPDLTKVDDTYLAEIVAKAFLLGLRDGRELSGPIDSYSVLKTLHIDNSMRKIHRVKIRQVYGAGFDISAANVRIAKREVEI